MEIRCQTFLSLDHHLQRLYSGCQCTEKLSTKEWALIGSLNSAEIPAVHRLAQISELKVSPEVWNSSIHEAGLRTQNYDKGFDRFIRKFDPDLPMSAIMAITANLVQLSCSHRRIVDASSLTRFIVFQMMRCSGTLCSPGRDSNLV
jgi:hypothetical protein